jgi:hypothetical protein
VVIPSHVILLEQYRTAFPETTPSGSGLFQANRPGDSVSGLRKVGAMQGYVVFGLLKLVSTAPAAEAQEAGPFADGVRGSHPGRAVEAHELPKNPSSWVGVLSGERQRSPWRNVTGPQPKQTVGRVLFGRNEADDLGGPGVGLVARSGVCPAAGCR